ncbi:AraC family transcriptional regulator [Lysobacter pythonis]|uniref:AraC family transcriptional regulator n=1 Tax=Solilutibacter pythonis TaxID=2483112 RepID=A0A3M2I0Y6_9GAMM|nr:AraC family transcriptional regulator [Lysobacter pythonis]RMH93590.1 AraC family transcriptional regulator [Lysobacter pythonis]
MTNIRETIAAARGQDDPLLPTDQEAPRFTTSQFNNGTQSQEILELPSATLSISTLSFKDGFHIVLFDGVVCQPVTMPIRDSGEYLSLAFLKNGAVNTRDHQGDFSYSAEPGCGALMRHGSFSGEATFMPSDTFQMVSICMPRGYLAEFESPFERIPEHSGNLFAYLPVTVTPTMRQCVDLLLEAPKNDVSGQLFLNAKACELMSLTVQALLNQNPHPPGLNPQDVKRIYRARDILDEQLESPPTIPKLARLIGTNDFKLKRDFRMILNTTPHAYVIRRRMEVAHEALTLTDTSITAIAQKVGYNNVSHFSSTFHKHYGVLPKQLKQACQARSQPQFL